MVGERGMWGWHGRGGAGGGKGLGGKREGGKIGEGVGSHGSVGVGYFRSW